ncbi:MAG: hypothetical protein KDK25_10965 [Leptospiraceae bacterium]|nr:hypothetical protein [Leptospiraceae bacterium]MCB1170850.1 hypothetical protein [Leptospiraceae bacterium]
MKLSSYSPGVLLVFFFFLPFSLLADRVVLRNGQILNGQIINQNQTAVVIRTRNGVQTVAKAQIARIQYGDFPDPEEERQKQEEERRKQEEQKREQERREEQLRRQEELRKQREELRREEQEKRENADDAGDPMEKENRGKWYSFLAPSNLSQLYWDPGLTEQKIKVGLGIGTVRNNWMGDRLIRSYLQTDFLFSRQNAFQQKDIEARNGWHLTGDLEYSINRYFIQFQASVSRQQGEAPFVIAGPQRDITIDQVTYNFGNMSEFGNVRNDRMRWEDQELHVGYRILYGGLLDLDLMLGMHRSVTLADLDQNSLALFDENPDRQFKFRIFRASSEMQGLSAGLRGIYRLSEASYLPKSSYSFLFPDLEWSLFYRQLSGTLGTSQVRTGISILYGARGQDSELAVDYRGTGMQGAMGLVFKMPWSLSLHIGGEGSSILMKSKEYYNRTSDNDLAGLIRAQIFPFLIPGQFTTRDIRRSTYLRLQWEYAF